MATVIAMQFEWHQVDRELRAARQRLTEALGASQSEAAVQDLHFRVTELEARCVQLLGDIERTRAARNAGEY